MPLATSCFFRSWPRSIAPANHLILHFFTNNLKSKKVGEKNGLDAVGGPLYLADTFASVANPAHARHYAGIIQDLATKRRVVNRCEDWLQHAHNGRPASELLELIGGDLEGIGQQSSGQYDGTGKVKFPVLNAAELDAATFDLEFLIKGVLVANHNCGIIGGSKTLKTSLASTWAFR